jgi:hypothetical protein
MSIPKVLACLSLLAAPLLASSQTSPGNFTVVQNTGTPGATSTIYRSGSKALIVFNAPAQGATPASRTFSLYDLAQGTNYTWNPDDNNVPCSAGTFSGDWGDPFAIIELVNQGVASGEIKPAGNETLNGIPAQVYTSSSPQGNQKIWVDMKDHLVLRDQMTAPGAAPANLIDVTKFSLAPPAASLFVLPARCAGVKPPPTQAQLIADETGDDPNNYVTAYVGPGSKNSCTVVLRVVQAKTMAPLTNLQVGIDTQYDQNDPNPPHYNFGVSDSGRETMSGGHLREITTGIHNGVVSLGSVPPYFNLVVNAVHPGHTGGSGLIYRQCSAPTTVLLFLYKNYGQSDEGVDALWVKSGKYATPPAH